MKRLLSIFVAAAMLLAAVPALAFSDTDGHWASAAIEAMAAEGVLNGYPDGSFRPDAPVTRAEFAKIITELYGYDTTDSGYLTFPDVEQDAWYGPYLPAYLTLVNWQLSKACEEYGYPDGWSADTFANFDGNRTLTRIEAAQAVRCAVGIDDGSHDDELLALALTAADSADFSGNRGICVLIGAVMNLGIMTGGTDGRFRPFDTVTRAEVCTLLNRAYNEHGQANANEFITMACRYAGQKAGKSPEQIEAEEREHSLVRAFNKAKSDGYLSEDKMTGLDNEPYALVDGVSFSKADYNLLYRIISSDIAQFFAANGIEDWKSMTYGQPFGNNDKYYGLTWGEAFEKGVAETMSWIAAAQTRSGEFGLDQRRAVVDARDALTDLAKEDADYDEIFKLWDTTEYAMEKLYYNEELVEQLLDCLKSPGGPCCVTDEDVKENYLKASHVLIMADSDDAAALARAEEVITLLDAGEDMKSLIALYGEDPGMTVSDYYFFTEGDMVDEFYEGTKALSPGQYSKSPVKTDYGYHVIYRLPIDGGEPEFEFARSELSSKKLQDYMYELIKDTNVVIYQ